MSNNTPQGGNANSGQGAFGGGPNDHEAPTQQARLDGDGQPYGQNSAYGQGQQPYGSSGQQQYGQQNAAGYGQAGSDQQYGQQQYGSSGQQYGGQQQYGQQQYASSGQQPYGQQQYGSAPGDYGQQQAGYPAQSYGGQGYAMNGVQQAMPYASWGKRVGAALIDYLLTLPFALLSLVFMPRYTMYQDTGETKQTGGNIALMALMELLALAVALWNQGYKQGTTGQSVGKKVLGISLLSEQTGRPIGFGMAVVRQIAHILDGIPCYVGYLWPLWDAKKQTFADKIMKTVVVDQPKA